MPAAETLPLYRACVANSRDLRTSFRVVGRLINSALKRGDQVSERTLTRLYALTYSSYVEASFMKLVLTPHGFPQDQVDQILSMPSVQAKWHRAIDLAFLDFSSARKSSEVPNKTKELKDFVDEYVVDPSKIRNKLAHGQFNVALNNTGTKINITKSNDLASMTSVDVYKWFMVHGMLSDIIEDLVESPDNAHNRNYYVKFQNLEAFITRTMSWTVATKMKTPSMSKRPLFKPE